MSMTFRIAAGIVIGLLAFQIIMLKIADSSYESYTDKAQSAADHRLVVEVLREAIRNYYYKYDALPRFAADLECRGRRKCADGVRDGVFYLHDNSDWIAVTPSAARRRLSLSCATTYGDRQGSGCSALSADEIPAFEQPSFACSGTLTRVKQMICASDRLTHSELLLSRAYRQAMANAASDSERLDQLRRESGTLLDALNSKCTTEKCVDLSLRKAAVDLGVPLTDGDEVFFVDAALERCVKRKITDVDTVQKIAALGITELVCANQGIASLTGIENLASLQRLTLNRNEIADISSLAPLHSLTFLWLEDNAISDISALRGLASLENISLSGNPVGDLSPLVALTGLKQARIPDAPDYDCAVLQQLSSRPTLHLDGKKDFNVCGRASQKIAIGYKGYDCSNAATGPAATICGSDQLKYLDNKLVELYQLAQERSSAPEKLQREQNEWQRNHEQCLTSACLGLSYHQRLERLGRIVRTHNVCSIEQLPLILYRQAWTTAVTEREPADYVSLLGADTNTVYFFSEILGGRNRTVSHRWYKNGVLVSETPFAIHGNRWGVWSSKTIDDHSAHWEVRIVDESGCVIAASLLPLGDSTIVRTESLSGWMNADDATDGLIINHDKSRLSLIGKVARTNREYLTKRNRWGDTPLLTAVRVGNTEAAGVLLKAGASPYVWDAEERTALQLAKELGHDAIADLLVEQQASAAPPWSIVDSRITDSREGVSETATVRRVSKVGTALFCISKTYGIKGRKVRHDWQRVENGRWKTAHSVEMEAVADAWDAISEYSLPTGKATWRVNIYVDDQPADSVAFSSALQQPGQGDDTQWLPKRHPNLGALKKLALAWAPVEMVDYFIAQDDAPQHTVYAGLLTSAVDSGNINLVRYLGAKHLFPKQARQQGELLNLATKNRRHEVLVYLLAAGFDPNRANERADMLPLHLAADNADLEALQMLLDWGADTERRAYAHMTALHKAAYRCSLVSAELLLQRGASPLAMNRYQKTPLDIVHDKNCQQMPEWEVLFAKYTAPPLDDVPIETVPK